MTRIVRTAYRYKRPPRRKKAPGAVGALEVPAVVTAKRSRRLIGKKAAAEMQLAPVSGRTGAVQPSTPREAERVVRPAATTDRKPAIVTIRRTPAKLLPPGLLAETPEEHQRRGDAADAMWRELVRRVAEQA
jgi:hypothetical protein